MQELLEALRSPTSAAGSQLMITFPSKSITRTTKPKGTFLSVLHRGKCSVMQKGVRPTTHTLHVTIGRHLLQTSAGHWWAFQQVRLKSNSLWASARSQSCLNFHLIKMVPGVFLGGSLLLIFNHILQDTPSIYNHFSQTSWTQQSSEKIILTYQIYAYVECLCVCFISQLLFFFLLDGDTDN